MYPEPDVFVWGSSVYRKWPRSRPIFGPFSQAKKKKCFRALSQRSEKVQFPTKKHKRKKRTSKQIHKYYLFIMSLFKGNNIFQWQVYLRIQYGPKEIKKRIDKGPQDFYMNKEYQKDPTGHIRRNGTEPKRRPTTLKDQRDHEWCKETWKRCPSNEVPIIMVLLK